MPGARNDPTYSKKTIDIARSLCEQAVLHHRQADYAAARSLFGQALALLEADQDLQGSNVGQAALVAARCLNGLGEVLMKQGDYDQARTMVERALSLREQAVEPDHAEVASSLHTLGELESDQGSFETGLLLLEQAFSLRTKALGEGHPDTLDSMALLAVMLAHQGQRNRAEGLLLRALSLCEQTLGENHLVTARVLNGLGRVWASDRTTYERARTMYRRALAIYEHLLGQTHPLTALVLNNLAAVLADLRDYEAALPLLERSLGIHELVHGPSSWRTSFVLVNLADVHSQLGDAASARSLLERALIIREQAWGGQHPETVACLRKLIAAMGTLLQQGDEPAMIDGPVLYPCLVALEGAVGRRDPSAQQMPGTHLDAAQAAQRLHQWATTRQAELARPPLSVDEREVLQGVQDLVRQANAEHERGDEAAAVALLEEALDLQEQVRGKDYLDHVEILKKLANAQAAAGHYSAILPLTQRIVDIHVQVLGPEHPLTGLALTELMTQTAFEFGPGAALPLQEQLLHSMEAALGPEDPLVELARRSVSLLRDSLAEAAADSEAWPPSLSERREQAVAEVPPPGQDPLAGLDDVPWHDLHHAYGRASDVPNLLRMLTSGDEDVRHSAWDELYGNLYHQGDVYQATAYAVPFLIQVLEHPTIHDKHTILGYLQAIATSGPWLSDNDPWMEEVLARQGRDFQAEVQDAEGDAQAARAAVREGFDTYLSCLNHDDDLVREAALALLCSFPECLGETLPHLLTTVEREPEPVAQANMVHNVGTFLALASSPAERLPALELLRDLLEPAQPRSVRFAAAVVLAHLQGDDAPSDSITLLEEAIVEPRGLVPGSSGEDDEPAYLLDLPVEDACRALSHLGVARRIPILLRLLERIAVPAHAHRVAVLLLDSALSGQGRILEIGDPPEVTDRVIYYAEGYAVALGAAEERTYPQAEDHRDLASLTPEQKQILRAVLECRPLWRIRSNLLEMYGLPRSRAALLKSL